MKNKRTNNLYLQFDYNGQLNNNDPDLSFLVNVVKKHELPVLFKRRQRSVRTRAFYSFYNLILKIIVSF